MVMVMMMMVMMMMVKTMSAIDDNVFSDIPKSTGCLFSGGNVFQDGELDGWNCALMDVGCSE